MMLASDLDITATAHMCSFTEMVSWFLKCSQSHHGRLCDAVYLIPLPIHRISAHLTKHISIAESGLQAWLLAVKIYHSILSFDYCRGHLEFWSFGECSMKKFPACQYMLHRHCFIWTGLLLGRKIQIAHVTAQNTLGKVKMDMAVRKQPVIHICIQLPIKDCKQKSITDAVQFRIDCIVSGLCKQ